VPDHPTSTPAQFIQGCPVLHVRDLLDTAAYLRDVLGFHCDYGDEHYAVVWRDNSAVHLTKGQQEPSGVHLFQWIRDVDAYHAEISARGAAVSVAPGNRPYRLRDFSVVTRNGLTIVFGQEIA
jgi:hypothetical protein